MDRFLITTAARVKQQSAGELTGQLFGEHSVDAMAVSCLLLASKFDEIDDNIPLITEFCKAHGLVRDSLDGGFLQSQSSMPRLSSNRSQICFERIRKCEVELLSVLQWDLNRVTPMHFVQNFLYQGAVFTNDEATLGQTLRDRKVLQKVRRHVDYFALQALKQDFMLTKAFPDHVVAAAVIYAARKASKQIKESWNAEVFEHLFGISAFADIEACFSKLFSAYNSIHSKSQEPSHFNVQIKL